MDRFIINVLKVFKYYLFLLNCQVFDVFFGTIVPKSPGINVEASGVI